jgi:hypothetical protein
MNSQPTLNRAVEKMDLERVAAAHRRLLRECTAEAQMARR